MALALLGACTVGPNYVRPTADTPAAFKEMEGWKTAQPRDQELRGKWWETYNDPLLNELEERVSVSNQNLAQAAAQFRQARALVQSARAGYLPTASANASATRSQSPSGFIGQNQNLNSHGPSTSYSLSLDAVWEADLWGRVRRTVESNAAGAQASPAGLEALPLAVPAQLAQNLSPVPPPIAREHRF